MANKDGYRMSNRQLTEKHKELLPFLADDKSDREISSTLGVNIYAFYQRIERMMDILKLAGRDELVKYAKEYVKSEEHHDE